MTQTPKLAPLLAAASIAAVLIAGCDRPEPATATPPPARGSIAYCNHLEAVGGDALFAPAPKGSDGLMPMKYFADIEAEPLPADTADQGVHRVHLAITLLDRNDQVVQQLPSPVHEIRPGVTQRIEGLTEAVLPPKVVSTVEKMKLEMMLDHCPQGLPAPPPVQ